MRRTLDDIRNKTELFVYEFVERSEKDLRKLTTTLSFVDGSIYFKTSLGFIEELVEDGLMERYPDREFFEYGINESRIEFHFGLTDAGIEYQKILTPIYDL